MSRSVSALSQRTSKMTNYLSFPIVDEVVRFVEDSNSENYVKAMASGIFNYYFTATNDFLITPGRKRNDRYTADFTIFRILRLLPGRRGTIDHMVAAVKTAEDALDDCLDHLETALGEANTEFGRCWATLIRGPMLIFYEYHGTQTPGSRLIDWGSPTESRLNIFHVRNDAAIIDEMLRHISQSDAPPAR